MPHLLEHLDLFTELLKKSPFGLITDVDGTISHTTPTPQQAVVSRLCRHYLSILCRHLALVAAISGRPVVDMKNMIGIDGIVYIGNHGLERWNRERSEFTEEAKGYARIVKTVIKELTPLLSMEGITIEDKGITASIHYRLSPEPESARKAIIATLHKLPQARKLRIMEERKAIDLLPAVAANKGTAVQGLIQGYDLRGAIYLGDDVTDIDAFRAIHTACQDLDFYGFAIGIVSQEMPENFVSEVDYTLTEVSDVERFLEWMTQNVPQLS